MKPFITGLLSVVLAGAAGAATYASDNYTNATATASTMANTEAPGVGTYRRVFDGGSAYSVGTVDGFGSGNVMTLSNGNSTHVRTLNTSTGSSLGSLGVGSVLSMSFDMRLAGTLAESRSFSFGFLNDAGTSTQSSIAYALVGAAGGEFKRRDTSWNMSTSNNDGGGRAGSTFTGGGLAVDTNYTMRFTITKISETSYMLRYFQSVNGGAETMVAETSSPLTSTVVGREITAVGFRWSESPGVQTHIDNLLVTVDAVPEASSAALVMAAGMAGLLRRRRK